MMYGNRRRVEFIVLSTLCLGLVAAKPAPSERNVRSVGETTAAETSRLDSSGDSSRGDIVTLLETAGPALARSVAEPVSARVSTLRRLPPQSAVAGAAAGFTVYRNETLTPTVYRPGAGTLVADDLKLASGPTTLLQYSLVVFGTGGSGEPTFSVHTELWDGDPCEAGSAVIAGTERDFADIPNDGSLVELNAFFDTSPVAIPGTVYLAVTFGPAPAGNDAGWIVAGRPELGFTQNEWSEMAPASACQSFFFGCGSSYAGFWARVLADLPTPETGACCDGTSCSEILEADCTTGVWQGPFTTCTPNPCVAGACCTGALFDACEETSEAGCFGGLFYAGATCDTNPCAPVYADFANTFQVDGFHRVPNNVLRADDVRRFGSGECVLAGVEVLAIGNGTSGPPAFDATISLWTNLEGDGATDLDDVPNAEIPGTAKSFLTVPSDFCPQRLVSGSFVGSGITVPRKFWVSIRTNTEFAGPMLGGPAKIGGSLDGFAEFDTLTPGAWQPGFWFGGFDPTGCPSAETCVPAGSYRIVIWCAGARPTGACCDDVRGTCTDGVAQVDCNGRWARGETCAVNSFDPPCAHNACCAPNILNPNVLACINMTREACAALDPPGAFAPGQFCENTSCPSLTCYNATGDCFADNPTGGCEDAFCCEKVCAIDDFCCTSRWDSSCAQTAMDRCRAPINDEYPGALPVSGQGNTDFDNSSASSSGPNNNACATLGDLDGINNDLWYCWTAPCTDFVRVQTCNLTQVDTVVAVYEGCEGPPADANLVACNDDGCGFQSQASFVATEGNQYLIRVGSFSAAGTGGDDFPLLPVGMGSFAISCSGASHPACPGDGDCCDLAGTGTPGCSDTLCCNLVCACDPFCCDSEWDEFCATTGFEGNGCGAELLCGNSCVPSCPPGAITWMDPPDGVVDARLSLDLGTSAPRGIDVIRIEGPAGADPRCFTLCETAQLGAANDIINVVETPIVAGGASSMYTLTLLRPLTPFAATTITYTDDTSVATTGTFIAHPGNVNGDETATAADISALIDALNGVNPGSNAPWGVYSTDIDHSGTTLPPDILAAIDALIGAGPLTPSANTSKPSAAGTCPPP